MRAIFLSIVTFILFSLCNPGFSQLSIRGGMNLSNISIEDGSISVETDSKAGLQMGLMYSIGIGRRIALRPGAIFSVKGYKFLDTSVNLEYLEMPLSLILYLGGGRDGLFIELGPYAGAALDNDLGDIGDKLKTLDLGFNVGFGLELGNIGAGLTYGYGVGNIIDGEISGTDSISNTNIGVYGFIQF